MSNFADNIIDQSGQQVFLEDKHLNDQTSQTAIATTDAVMLKDTNGAYHSIDKGSFNEAVRAAMGSILTNFDKGTSITRIPGIDSNNDLGSVTAANLASVLGVPTVIATGDLSNVAGSPTPYYGTIVLYKAAYYPVWLCYGQSPHTIWYGITEHGVYDLTRVTWKENAFDIPSFYSSYSDLTSLASALGVVVETFDVELNAPISDGFIVKFKPTSNSEWQIIFGDYGTGMFTRYSWNGDAFTSWKQIVLNNVS